ncbi:MAG: DUF924 domain-containing protein [uncultured Thiotrichaceae bacterium]|uniref:DUF924 domain-containing protein n=1 Tax=uncultured Thiotrichaceae bacterium TaxID=298394 RepID=A0A6S6T3H1_9GAMM|nr:MAG: DUF924 domain-containing protein [uncultured Thiotrichaceae bacterium]
MNQHWFSSTKTIDDEIRERFFDIWQDAQTGKYQSSQSSATGALALCIILDQLPLNMFRGKAKSFSTEQQAIDVSKHAIKKQLDNKLNDTQVAFLYMPLMHSENLEDQQLSVHSFEKRQIEGNLRFAKHHYGIIKKFGRFPHRNKILQRTSTAEEIAYLHSNEAFTG